MVLFQNWQQTQASQNLVDSVERVRILPDTIKVNGDSLSFRGKADGSTFQVYYKLQSEEEKEYFQALTDLHEIELEGKSLNLKDREILVDLTTKPI